MTDVYDPEGKLFRQLQRMADYKFTATVTPSSNRVWWDMDVETVRSCLLTMRRDIDILLNMNMVQQ